MAYSVFPAAENRNIPMNQSAAFSPTLIADIACLKIAVPNRRTSPSFRNGDPPGLRRRAHSPASGLRLAKAAGATALGPQG